MLYNELTIGFPWYEKIEQQDRYNENVETVCDYKLISAANALLPFQFTKKQTGEGPVKWEVYEINSMVKVADYAGDLSKINRRAINGLDYIYYFGEPLANILPAGFYFSRLVFPDNSIYFSEMFTIPAKAFNMQDDDYIKFLRLCWYNKTDLEPIFYNDLDGTGVPKFKNVLYLDTFITASEPELEEEGERDGNNKLIITFQKLTIQYRITVIVPDFLKKALMAMQLHDTVILTTKNGVRSGKLDHLTVTSEPEANGGLSVVDILFTEDLALVKKGCGQNMQ